MKTSFEEADNALSRSSSIQKVGETFWDTFVEVCGSSLNLAPFGGTFSEEEEAAEDESVSRMIGLQFSGEWCWKVTGWDVWTTTLLSPRQNSKIAKNMELPRFDNTEFHRSSI